MIFFKVLDGFPVIMLAELEQKKKIVSKFVGKTGLQMEKKKKLEFRLDHKYPRKQLNDRGSNPRVPILENA